MSSVGGTTGSTTPPPQVVAFVCCDLGGTVRDWDGLIKVLNKGGYKAEPWERSEEAWQVNYRITHAPVISLERESVELQLPGLSPDHLPVREIRIYPLGVIVFRYLMWPDPSAGFSALYQLRRQFQHFRKRDYVAHLRDFYGEPAKSRYPDLTAAESDAGISVLPTVLDLRQRAAGFIDERPIYPAQYARWALCVCPRPDGSLLEEHLASLAAQKRLAYPPDTLEGRVNREQVDTLRLRAWPGLVQGSWEGFDVYLAADDAKIRETALEIFELQHQFAFICRAWIEILDREPAIEIPALLTREDVKELERRMRRLTTLERSLSANLVEVDSAEAMLVDTLHLELANDFAERFKLPLLKAMVFSRLDAITRETAFARDILDRNYQEAVYKRAENLQLLFAGAVAAALTALIPATLALDTQIQPLVGRGVAAVVAVVALTIVIWAGFAYVARRFFSWSAPSKSGQEN